MKTSPNNVLTACASVVSLLFCTSSFALPTIDTNNPTPRPTVVSTSLNNSLIMSTGWDDSVLLSKGDHDIKTLIITVEFADQLATVSNEEWAARLQGDVGEKSLYHYFVTASYGQVKMTPALETYGKPTVNGVIGPIMMKSPKKGIDMYHPNTGSVSTADLDEGNREQLNEIFSQAIAGADPYIDFSSFNQDGDQFIDSSELAIFIVLAGYDAVGTDGDLFPTMRGHAQNFAFAFPDETFPSTSKSAGLPVIITGAHAKIGELSKNGDVDGDVHATTLGLFAHEAGHFVFGLPDLYDFDDEVNGDSKGIDMYGLMAKGSQGMDPTVDQFRGETPVLPSAWSLYKLGWGKTTTHFWGEPLVSAGSPLLYSQLTANAVTNRIGKVIPGVLDPITGAPDCSSREYFLFHYRTAEGYDRGLPAVLNFDYAGENSGVVIYHIDENQRNNDTADKKLVDVEEAGVATLESSVTKPLNLWVNNGVNEYIFDANSSNSNSNVGEPAVDDSGVSITVGSPTVDSDNASAINITVMSNCQDTGTTALLP